MSKEIEVYGHELENYGDEHLSNFEGDLDIDDDYTGEDDDFVNFAGGSNFANVQQAGRIFVMTFKNESKTAKNIVLFPGYSHDAKSGILAKNGDMFQVASGEKIVATSSPTNIGDLQGFVAAVPSDLVGIRVASKDEAQMQQVISIKEKSPFKKTASKEIFIGTHQSETSNREDMVTIPTPDVVLGSETEITIPILPKATLTLTFFIGGVLSTSSALRKKSFRAKRTISMFRRR